MGSWIDDANPSPEVRARLAQMNDEWRAVDQRIANESDPDKISALLGRIDELEFEIDELVRRRGSRIEDLTDAGNAEGR